ncbi:MAG: type II toxin-antitoxin system HicB family antitoxin [Candidatus Dadabacteria bacterium]|nr:MAG: type II toxin-antitoxin system HicB family antitoxin [Candidatus Dadabacteria bacterium]
MKKKYLIVIEETKSGYSAYCPDLPGCVATGDSQEEVEASMKEAIEFHLEGMKAEGIEIPPPKSKSAYYETEAA